MREPESGDLHTKLAWLTKVASCANDTSVSYPEQFAPMSAPTQDTMEQAASKSRAQETELREQLQAASIQVYSAQEEAAQLRASCSDSESVQAQVGVLV